MPDLDPSHVEAVSGCLVSDHDRYHCLTHEDWSVPVEGGPCQTGREQAQKMLTSTDPAVHAALLAALVRAGVLTEDATWTYEDEDGRTMHSGFAWSGETPRRRYVTRWEDVDADFGPAPREGEWWIVLTSSGATCLSRRVHDGWTYFLSSDESVLADITPLSRVEVTEEVGNCED